MVVVPVFAVGALHANPFAMGVLAAAGLLPRLLIALPVASRIDKSRNQVRQYGFYSLCVGLATLAIPLGWWLGFLGLTLLITLVGVEAATRAIANTYAPPVTVLVAPQDRLVEANGQLNSVMSASAVVGQALGGLLLKVASAPIALTIDAASSIVGAFVLGRIPQISRNDNENERVEFADPVSYDSSQPPSIWQILHRVLRDPEVLCVASIGAFGGVVQVAFVLHAVDNLQIAGSTLGILIATGAVGGVVGGLVVQRISVILSHRTVVAACLVTISSIPPLLLVQANAAALVAIIYYEFTTALGGTVLIAYVFSQLEGQVARTEIARTMAAVSTLLQTAALIGVGVGTIIASLWGVRVALASALAFPPVPLAILATRATTRQQIEP